MIRLLDIYSKVVLNKKQMKTIGIILIFALFISCSRKHITLEKASKYPVKFSSQKITSPNIDFEIYIPKNWEWKIEDYGVENIITAIDAASKPSQEGFIDIISIQKIQSFGNNKDLKSEYEYYIGLIENQSRSLEIIEKGQTNILKEKAYFIHTKSNTGTYGEIETITFIVESKDKGVFFNISAGASQTKDLMKHMAIIIQSVKTFNINLEK